MSILPSCFFISNESYITVPIIRHFLGSIEDELENKSFVTRSDYIQAIEEYAAKSDENTTKVLSWVDSVLKQGIVEMHIYSVENSMTDMLSLRDGTVVSRLDKITASLSTPFLCKQPASSDFRIVNYSYSDTESNKLLSVSLYKTVYVRPKDGHVYPLTYPVHIDYYIGKNLLIIRGKSKTNLYPYTNDDSMPDWNNIRPISLDTLLKDALAEFKIQTGLSVAESSQTDFLKGNLYHLLEQYTHTPTEIEAKIAEASSKIQELMTTIKDGICHLDNTYDEDLSADLKNLIEKYLSISHPDKQIFTRDREAYPLKLSAKDDEDSKVEQTAAFEEPLQSKAVFFDNKKMMQRSKQCEGSVFIYQRADPRYFNKNFKVSFSSKAKCFVLKFFNFTVEEDIQHVLTSLLNVGTISPQ